MMLPRRIPGPAELLGRGRQWASAAADRRGWLPWGHLSNPERTASAGSQLPFVALTEQSARALDHSAIVARANAVLAGRFPLLGVTGGIPWGTTPDWFFDPLSGKRAPRAHFTRVPYLDEARVGDHKVTWELNRHQWLLWLAQAARLTGEARYHDAIVQHWEQWLNDNPRGVGINWASSLEVAFRSIAWCVTLQLLPGALPAPLAARVMESLHHHGRHVERWLSTWFSPNTHLTGEALGLLYLGVAFPSLPRAARWREQGWGILRAQATVQLRPDGSYFEQTGWYQAYTADFYLHALALAAHAKLSVPAAVRERVHAACHALHAMTCVNGQVVRWGDDDGGRLLPLGTGAYGDVRDTLAHAAVFFEDAALLSASAGGPEAHTVSWLLGEGAQATLARLSPARPPREESRVLRDGGWVALRSAQLEVYMVAGPHGALSGAHAHADALSISLCANGRPVLSDPGTYRYMGAGRDEFRSTPLHSALTVGSASSATSAGPFRWARTTNARIELVQLVSPAERPAEPRVQSLNGAPSGGKGTPTQMVRASHDGYATLAVTGSGRVSRELQLWEAENLLLVIDRTEGCFAEPVQLHWRPCADVHAHCEGSTITLLANTTPANTTSGTGAVSHVTPPAVEPRTPNRAATLATIVISSDWRAATSVNGYSAGYGERADVVGAIATPCVAPGDSSDSAQRDALPENVAVLSVVCPGDATPVVRVDRLPDTLPAWRVQLASGTYVVRAGVAGRNEPSVVGAAP